MQVRQAIDRVWKALAQRSATLLALALLVLILGITLALPQIPVPASETTSFNRWLAEVRPRLGDQTRLVASLGLLTIRTSLIMRLALGYLGLLVAVNADSLREKWDKRPWTLPHQIAHALLCVGALLIIGGWATQMLWGWREPDVITWPGEEIVVAQRDLSLDQPPGPLGFWQERYGLYIIPRGQRTGLEIRASDEDTTLLLLPSVNEQPQETLRLALTTQEPEAFFAIQEAELIFRLNQIEDIIQVQAYRSASGELLAEAQLDNEEVQRVLTIHDVEVTITQTLLPRYEVVYNPGAFFEGLGMMAFAAGAFARFGADPSEDEDESAPDAGPEKE
ncbi:MAG: hypothetical protein ACP5HS_05500 [Anaerolineae bacterium]